MHLDARIEKILEGNIAERLRHDPEFYNRILETIQWRQQTGEVRGTLSWLETAGVLNWLKKVADDYHRHLQGKRMSLEDFQDGITGCGSESNELFIHYVQATDVSSADVIVNGAHVATLIREDGATFAVPVRRRLKFDTARDFICNAHRQQWFEIPGDDAANFVRHTELFDWLGYIREQDLAYRAVTRWKNRAGRRFKGKIPVPDTWISDIHDAEKEILGHTLKKSIDSEINELTLLDAIEAAPPLFCEKVAET
jgi:hypothetical protein